MNTRSVSSFEKTVYRNIYIYIHICVCLYVWRVEDEIKSKFTVNYNYVYDCWYEDEIKLKFTDDCLINSKYRGCHGGNRTPRYEGGEKKKKKRKKIPLQ